MHLKPSRAYTLTLAIAMVVGPFVWLVMTADGQRRTDLALLHLLGRPSFNVALERLTPAVTEQTLGAQFPRVRFDCRDQPSTLGERVCVARIGAFNGVPARSAQVFYRTGGLSAVRLDYQVRYHGFLLSQLRGQHGAPQVDADLLTWGLLGGRLLLPAQTPGPADAALVWLAPAALAR